MEQNDLRQADLEPILGSRWCVSEMQSCEWKESNVASSLLRCVVEITAE
jgi:hypothetical protein